MPPETGSPQRDPCSCFWGWGGGLGEATIEAVAQNSSLLLTAARGLGVTEGHQGGPSSLRVPRRPCWEEVEGCPSTGPLSRPCEACGVLTRT